MIAAMVAIAAMAVLFVIFGMLGVGDKECDGSCPGCPAAGVGRRGTCEHKTEERAR